MISKMQLKNNGRIFTAIKISGKVLKYK